MSARARTRMAAALRGRASPWVWAASAALVVLLMLPAIVDTYWLQLGYRTLQLLTLALAWNLLSGYAGQVSLGNGAFVGLGAYAMAELGRHSTLPLWLLLPASALLAVCFALLVSPAMFRLRGLYFTIGSLALAEALRILMVNLTAFGGASGIVLTGTTLSFAALYRLELAQAGLAALLILAILRSPVSLSLRAVRDDEAVAQQMGVRTFRVKLGAFTLAAFLMGLVGAMQALKLGAIEPYGAFSLSWTIDTVAVVIIGGLGTGPGPVLGTVLYVALGEWLRNLPELHSAITGLILLLIIRLAPRGLWPVLRQVISQRRRAPEIADG